jgi:hypothetical protein
MDTCYQVVKTFSFFWTMQHPASKPQHTVVGATATLVGRRSPDWSALLVGRRSPDLSRRCSTPDEGVQDGVASRI